MVLGVNLIPIGIKSTVQLPTILPLVLLMEQSFQVVYIPSLLMETVTTLGTVLASMELMVKSIAMKATTFTTMFITTTLREAYL
jgi:hypothetical protein